ncbi:MAG: PAS domain S-box protein [Opitutaceae bacterium]|nr:PAS domain S-box protein [Verrucomicrobiales bacterium]
MAKALTVLILEDEPKDAEMVIHELRQAGYSPEFKIVATELAYVSALRELPDVILADYFLAGFDALRALDLLQELRLEIPFILVTGALEEIGLECLRRGASDYLIKDRLARLGPAVRHAVEKARLRREREATELALRESEQRFRRIFESNMVGILFWRTNGDITEANDSYLNMVGYTRDDVMSGRLRWSEITPPEYGHLDEKAIQEILTVGCCDPFEKEYIRKNGTRVPVVIGATMLDGSRDSGVCFVLDITSRKNTEAALLQIKEQLQSLSHRLIEVQETERRHLARELHDEIGQNLTAAKINLQTILSYPDPSALKQRLEESITLLDRLLEQTRNLSLDLRPPLLDHLGLVPTLRWYASQQAHRSRIRIQFQGSDGVSRLSSLIETTCFRVAQEAITNAVRHSKAASMTVNLRIHEQHLHLRVTDDGVGFDPSKVMARASEGASLGWIGMRERVSLAGGRIECKSSPDTGTEINAWFPMTIDCAVSSHSFLEPNL